MHESFGKKANGSLCIYAGFCRRLGKLFAGKCRASKTSFCVGSITTLGKTASVERMPRHAADVDSTWADIGKAARLLGWRPEISLERGLEGAVEWYLEQREWAKDISA